MLKENELENKNKMEYEQVKAENCIKCDLYEICFLDGSGTEVEGKCKIGYVWKLKKK